jgi:hypothetical protein
MTTDERTILLRLIGYAETASIGQPSDVATILRLIRQEVDGLHTAASHGRSGRKPNRKPRAVVEAPDPLKA